MSELHINNENGREVLRALANEYRLRILSICRKETVLQSRLPRMLEISSPSVSIHVRTLYDVGLVDVITDRKNKMKKYVKSLYDKVILDVLPPSSYT